MISNIPNPALKRIREKAPHRQSMSLPDEHIERLSYLKKAFTTVYAEEAPFSFSKTISKTVDLANLMILDPELMCEEEQVHQEFIQKFSPTFRKIRKRAPNRRSVSLTDEDIQKFSYLEKTFTKIYPEEIPFSFSKTVSKAVDLAIRMVLDRGLLFDQDQEFFQELSEEDREQLKYEIENGLLYRQNVLLSRARIAEIYKDYVAALKTERKLIQAIAELKANRKLPQAI